MVVGFTTTYVISVYLSPLTLWFRIPFMWTEYNILW